MQQILKVHAPLLYERQPVFVTNQVSFLKPLSQTGAGSGKFLAIDEQNLMAMARKHSAKLAQCTRFNKEMT